MKLFHLIRKESDQALTWLIVIGVISGAANATLLAIINKASENDAKGEDNSFLFVTCMVVIVLFLISKKYVLNQSCRTVYGVLKKIRTRIGNKIRYSELLMMEEIGSGQVYARITDDSQEIALTTGAIANAFQSAIMIIFSVVYVGFISIPAFLVIIIAFSLGTFVFIRRGGNAKHKFKKAARKESEFFEALNALLEGFKEVKINQKKSNNVFRHFKKVTSETIDLKIGAKLTMITSQLISQSFFYFLLIVIIFVLPAFNEVANQDVVKISAAVLFIIGPIEATVGVIPKLMESNIAAENILNMEAKLESQLEDILGEEEKTYAPLPFEKEIVIDQMKFAYPKKDDVSGFSIGPLNITIPKGKIIFITGGNGAGKSTFLKLLCGLYYPDKGAIYLDNIKVDQQNYQNYREILSMIFTDFFLFDRLFGLDEVDDRQVNKILKDLNIASKTEIINGKITELNLSTGQRKRLALAITILEDRPVYVFDEVAADQDPNFKKYFYHHLLPDMKKKGKTLVVVTHDDHYFDVADIRIKIEDGQLIQSSASS